MSKRYDYLQVLLYKDNTRGMSKTLQKQVKAKVLKSAYENC